MIDRIVVPEFDATGGDVKIVEWLVKEGDKVEAGRPIFSVETDKAVIEVEAFRGGYIRRILVETDSDVAPGTVVAIITDSADEPIDAVPHSAPGKNRSRGDVPAVEDSRPLPASEPAPGRVTAAPVVPRVYASKDIDATASGKAMPTETLLDMYRRMVLIRKYEDYLHRLFLQGQVPGTLHQCQGQEASAVGVCSALRVTDAMFSTHRPVGHFLAKGASLNAITAEIWGKGTGCAGGKGGQMHLVDMSVTSPPSNAIVGGNIPIATGMAIGFRMQGLDSVAVCFFGDGASNTGAFHEGLNFAAVKKAPVVFVCENNLYAASTSIRETVLVKDIAERAAAYGMPGVIVDGMDVVAVYRAAVQAVARARKGDGPTLLECKTYRYSGHSRGDACGYRSKEEVESWRKKDPIPRCRALLLEEHPVTKKALAAIEDACTKDIEAAVVLARSSADPAPATCFEHVFTERI